VDWSSYMIGPFGRGTRRIFAYGCVHDPCPAMVKGDDLARVFGHPVAW
jgi:hypothetical protein